jgi:hypothetical protein
MTITEMNANYGKTTDEQIRLYLTKIKLVKKEHKGINSVYGYYPISDEFFEKIYCNPRKVSYNLDESPTQDTPVSNLVPFKSIPFICRSSSRFFLKADIGEVFDQIKPGFLEENKIKAIDISLSSYQGIDNTQGEHFLMSVVLLQEIIDEKTTA